MDLSTIIGSSVVVTVLERAREGIGLVSTLRQLRAGSSYRPTMSCEVYIRDITCYFLACSWVCVWRAQEATSLALLASPWCVPGVCGKLKWRPISSKT